MKKLIAITAILALVPLSAFAMQPMTDSSMAKITAQDGVSIAVDDVKLYQNIAGITYTDNDGTDGTAGSISLSNLSMMVNINAITALSDGTAAFGSTAAGTPFSPGRPVQGTYDPSTYNYSNVWNSAAGADAGFLAKAITIDVGTCALLSAGATENYDIANSVSYDPTVAPSVTMAGVTIGLGTMEIQQSALTFDVSVSESGAYNDGAKFGTISIGNSTLAVLDGVIEIAPH